MDEAKGKMPSSAYKTVIINKMLLQFVDFIYGSKRFKRHNRRPLTVCVCWFAAQTANIQMS